MNPPTTLPAAPAKDNRSPVVRGADWRAMDTCGCCGEARSARVDQVRGLGVLRCEGCDTLRFEAVAPPGVVYTDDYHVGTSEYGWNWVREGEQGELSAVAEATVAWIERYVAPGRLVDVGGGLGYFAAAAASRGWDAELLDPVPRAVDYARTKLGLRATCGDARKLADAEEPYRVVAIVHALEHIQDAAGALKDARNALDPRGMVFVEVPNHASMSRRLQGCIWMGWQPGEHIYLFSPRTLERVVRAAGLEPVAVRTSVPFCDGLLADGYAHLLGLQRSLDAATGAKHALSAALRGRRAPGHDEGPGQPSPPPRPVRDIHGWRSLLYRRGFDGLARLESRFGVATNIQLLARPR